MSVKEESNLEMTECNSSRDSRESVVDTNKIIEWISGLKDVSMRKECLAQLSKKREAFDDLALYLWYTPGIVSVL